MATGRTYKDVIEALPFLATNPKTPQILHEADPDRALRVIPETIEYLGRIGYTPADLNKLNVIHVAGTKGKGSTCTFTDSIIRHTLPKLRVGVVTGPPLVSPRERIRISGLPLSEDEFARFFFEVWDRLEQNNARQDPETWLWPPMVRYMTLLAFHVFLTLEVDVMILETNAGGAFDASNIVPKPCVTGITSLGLDHIPLLGNTLSEIAWHKGGIFKGGVPAFSVPQPHDAMSALELRAEELKPSSFNIVSQDAVDIGNVKLGLAGEHQRQNAILALHLAHTFITRYQTHPSISSLATTTKTASPLPVPIPAAYIQGLQATRLPGRCQVVLDPNHKGITWFLDGAHTVESITCCAEWFISPDVALRPTRPNIRVLIFNCIGNRRGDTFLAQMLSVFDSRFSALSSSEKNFEVFDHVIFCADLKSGDQGELLKQQELASAWSSFVGPSFPHHNIHVLPSVEDAVKRVKEFTKEEGEGAEIDVLVTGSLRLVGRLIVAAGLEDAALACFAHPERDDDQACLVPHGLTLTFRFLCTCFRHHPDASFQTVVILTVTFVLFV